jgi:hypothetical protein
MVGRGKINEGSPSYYGMQLCMLERYSSFQSDDIVSLH